MNYQKLIDLKRTGRWVVLFICSITLMFLSCRNQQAKVSTADTIPLPITYVTKIESEIRQNWFDKYKYPILDSMTMKDEGVNETKGLNFKGLDAAIKFFDSLIVNKPNKDTTTGVRIYFAAQPLKLNGCGKLTLIFTATAGAKNVDGGDYYAFKNENLDINLLDIKTAKEWVYNYQQKKRLELSKYTMDTNDPCKETKHIFFSLKQIKSIIAEMKYQKGKHSSLATGFGVRFTSYTDTDYIDLLSKKIQYHKRLTIGFTFMSGNNDIGIEDIDPAEFKERLEATTRNKDRFIGDTFDTGVPAPPPPTNDNMAALDYEI
nr:hypothetical protein [uncultured Pedobacter sp.]